jgi:hypothetical protein
MDRDMLIHGQDTIFAIASGAGRAAIGVWRRRAATVIGLLHRRIS